MHPTLPAAFHGGLVTRRFAETCEFYCQHFGFSPLEISAEYALLGRADGARLGILQADGEGQPAALCQPTRGAGVWLRLETDDVDALHARLVAEDTEIVDDPGFTLAGHRRCVARDPNGVLVYIEERHSAFAATAQDATLLSSTQAHHHENHSNRVRRIPCH